MKEAFAIYRSLRSVLALSTFALSAAAQTTLHVPGDHTTIQAAIVAASPGDTVLVAAGTYVEELDYLGKAITVASASGAAATVLSNVNSAVSFVSDEGPGSVLRGFTVTGNLSSRAAIHGPGTQPRIERCIIRDNRTSTALAAGVQCDGTLEDCVIEGNANGNGTGGVAGALTLVRCTLSGNVGYDGAAALLLGGSMTDCFVLDNASAEGSAGGAVSISSATPVTLLGCVLARNTKDTWSGQYSANGAALNVQPFSVAATLVNCTVIENRVPVPGVFGPDHGGLHGQVTLVNCIVGNNDGEDFDPLTTSATYSNLAGLAGLGNFSADPLFRDAPNGDFRLLPGSPCIDTGDPASPLDPDATRADVGALEFTHASVFPLSGSGANPALLASLTPPAIGTSWQATIQAALVPGPLTSGIQVRTGARALPLVTPFGELLISGTVLGSAQLPSNGTLDAFSFALPADPALLGRTAHAQGYVLTSSGPTLGNGLTLLVGE